MSFAIVPQNNNYGITKLYLQQNKAINNKITNNCSFIKYFGIDVVDGVSDSPYHIDSVDVADVIDMVFRQTVPGLWESG